MNYRDACREDPTPQEWAEAMGKIEPEGEREACTIAQFEEGAHDDRKELVTLPRATAAPHRKPAAACDLDKVRKTTRLANWSSLAIELG